MDHILWDLCLLIAASALSGLRQGMGTSVAADCCLRAFRRSAEVGSKNEMTGSCLTMRLVCLKKSMVRTDKAGS